MWVRWLGAAALLGLLLFGLYRAMPPGVGNAVLNAGYGGGATPEFNCPAEAPSLAFLSTSATPQPLGVYEPQEAASRVDGQPWSALHTSGNQIVDESGEPVRLAAVNWYGAESADFVPMGLDRQPVQQIANEIAAMGFTAVRLPWSNELVECNPLVPEKLVAANPQFFAQPAMTVFDGVVNALAKAGLMVILDNHMTDAGWCCEENDENDLWWSGHEKRGPLNFISGQTHWTDDWETMLQRYANQPAVIGADLRNEPRGAAYWGDLNGNVADSSQAPPNHLEPCPVEKAHCDWHAAAQEEGNAIETRYPERFLIFVEGTRFGTDLTGAYTSPIVLNDPAELVYSPHAYNSSDYCNANSQSQCPPGSTWASGKHGSPPPCQVAGVNSPCTHVASFDFLAKWKHLERALDSQWGFLSESGDQAGTVTPIWLGEFGTGAWTSAGVPVKIGKNTDANRWFIKLASYLGQRPFGWAYWPLNGTQADSGPINSPRSFGKIEEYGILNAQWEIPRLSRHSLLSYLQQIQP